MERGTRIELVTLAWKARVIPFYESRVKLYLQLNLVADDGIEPPTRAYETLEIPFL